MSTTMLLTRLSVPKFGSSEEGLGAVTVKRAREPASALDGMRVLVDRFWPRGLARGDMVIDLWLKEASPSAPWRGGPRNDPARWAAFSQGYLAELRGREDLLGLLGDLQRRGNLTLLSDAGDVTRGHATLLREALLERSFIFSKDGFSTTAKESP